MPQALPVRSKKASERTPAQRVPATCARAALRARPCHPDKSVGSAVAGSKFGRERVARNCHVEALRVLGRREMRA